MWVARFRLMDDEDIYSPLCKKYKIEFFAFPYSTFVKNNTLNLVGGTISGYEENKTKFLMELKKDKRVKRVEVYRDFTFIHAGHIISRKAKAETRIFYNPQYIRVKPVHIASDGWEYWEVACLDRAELNKLIEAATVFYHGEIFAIRSEKLKNVTSLELAPNMTEKQAEAVGLAFRKGYYDYPRKLTIPQLARMVKRSYSTFQENLSKAENKIIGHFMKYR